MTELLLLTQLAATLFLTGLIWTIQLVHYPLFRWADAATFTDFQKRHMNAIGPLVLPIMLAELLTAAAAFWYWPHAAPAFTAPVGFALVTLIWLSTITLQVPTHNRLLRGFDPAAHRKLLLTNWIRTFLWTIRSALLLWITWLAIRPPL